ncbi:phosphoribosyltransferase-like protein [Suillus paluster]|uniref:phosphoribosyltransferase-like protein n=1 Tax=Suillus paluster TaxID=48578 RepID=UPI001B882DF7|nr:phosphoribosyltransferase-like protein [Suillus paluster]KAG1739198.1 phosphoribosyltransferase-like protein [Suillus paluster]
MSPLESYKTQLLEQAAQVGALKFGNFTLKSGRKSPYFFNAGLMSDGTILHTVAQAYAATLCASPSPGDPNANPFTDFDILFGPAYKGISFAACTALVLASIHGRDVKFAYDRKEAKDHGEGGNIVGWPSGGKEKWRVVVVDDVMTTGLAASTAINHVVRQGGEVVGVVQLLDREEFSEIDDQGRKVSSVMKLERLLGGKGKVRSVLKMRDLVKWLEEKEARGESSEEEMMSLQALREYRDTYGITSF